MKKAIGKRVLAMFVALALMVTASATFMFTQAETYDVHASVSANSFLSKTAFNYDLENPNSNVVTIDYTLNYKDIAKTNIVETPAEKDIVLIMDTSGSMDYSLGNSTRINEAKAAAISFLNDLKKQENVKVSLVNYARKASIYNEDSPLLDLSSNYTQLTSKINSYDPYGGTNIGDALRRASYVLQSGSQDAKKYVVLLTDGEPTAFSVDKLYGTQGSYYNDIGKYYYNYGSKSVYVSDITGADYLRTSGSAQKYYTNYTSSGDPLNLSLNYAKEMASKLLSDLPQVESYYIGFSDDSDANKLSLIADESAGIYYTAEDSANLNLVYNGIADQITSELTLTNVIYEEALPDGVTLVNSQGVSVEDNIVSKDFGTVTFTLNEEGTDYVADGYGFSIEVSPDQPGTYVFGANKTAALHYTDFDGVSRQALMPARTLTVLQAVDPDLRPDQQLDVLEIQPGRNFELNADVLENFTNGMTVNLRQMSMNEFDGNIEEVNGKYDVVYIGAIEDYDNYTITGMGSNSIKADIDITNRKAADIIDFANSGQLLIVDQDLLAMEGSKIKSNLSEITNLSNVHQVEYFNPTTVESLYDWYQGSNHRPRLTVKSQPKSYDGSQESYSADHLMSYLYSAYNEQDNPMSTYLYVDIDGDGIYEENEKVLKDNVQVDTADLTLNYSLEDTFNGLMPWKLELVDETTGSKDYTIGFSAYKGVKTIVNVLQLSPGTNRMNIASSSFVKPLVTDDYEINITYMQVSDFDAAYRAFEASGDEYPSDVNGQPTVLNGNYDMIIFGFGDSYGGTGGNKDLKSQAAIDAIDDFIQTGQSILFTHDTAGPQDWVNNFDMKTSTQSYNDYVSYNDAPNITANFKDDMGFSNTRTYAGKRMWRAWGSTDAYKLNEGLITMYPYLLADNPSKTLDIANTHDQYWEIDLESENVVPWFTLDAGNFKYYPAAYYYTFTNGNITYSGTGHSTPNGGEEQEFFVNTMLKASRGANHAPSLDVSQLYEGMNIVPSVDTVEAGLTIHDVDYQDQEFKVEVFTVYKGVEVRTRLLNKVAKEEPIDISFTKPATLDEDVDEFVIKVVVTDPHGAQGVEEFNVTHKEVPTLTISDNLDDGYLKGDTINLEYRVSTVREDDKDLIDNINLATSIDTSKTPVLDAPNWKVSGSTYSINPSFDGTTSYDMSLRATESVDLLLEGSYDVSFGVDTLSDQSVEKTSDINVKVGTVNVEVTDNLGRAIEGANIEILNSSDIAVALGTTDVSGIYKMNGLITDSYTVKITSLPPGYAELDVMSKAISLSYSNSSELVVFSAKDNAKPIIDTNYDAEVIVTKGEEVERTIHVMADGNNSKLLGLYMKKLDEGVTEAEPMDFTGSNASSNKLLTDYNPQASDPEKRVTPFNLDSQKPEDYQWAKYFTVSENGYYAIYAINESGNESVDIIYINTIINEMVLPDSI